MKLAHYLNELQSAQSSIKEQSQSLSKESLDNGQESSVEIEELTLELGPFRFSKKREFHRSSSTSSANKSLEETQSGYVDGHRVLSQNEVKKADLDTDLGASSEQNEVFSLWKGVNTQA